MNPNRNICLICVFTFIAVTFAKAQTKNACIDSLNYKVVQSRWNKKVEKLKTGTWKLILTPTLNVKEDSIIITQSLDGPSLYFVATVLKTGCVRKVTIKAKRDPEIGYASFVAWLYVIAAFNPELLPKERTKVLDDLKITEKISLFNSSTIRGNNTYTFEETGVGNTFTVLTKN